MKQFNFMSSHFFITLFLLAFTITLISQYMFEDGQSTFFMIGRPMLLAFIYIFLYIFLLVGVYYSQTGLVGLIKKSYNSRIKSDIESGKYQVYYQPLIEPSENKIYGYQAVIRHYENQLNKKFFEMKCMMDHNIMKDLSLWTLKKVIEDYEKIYKDKIDDNDLYDKFYISVSVLPIDLENDDFIRSCVNLLVKTEISYHSICIQLLESNQPLDLNKIVKSILVLREAGFLIAIDDFGSQYIKLSLIDDIYYDILKVKKHVTQGLEHSPPNQQVLKMLLDWSVMHHKMIVFEGIDTTFQKASVQHLTAQKKWIQGDCYTKPLSLEHILSYKVQDN